MTRQPALVVAMARPGLEALTLWSSVAASVGSVSCGMAYYEDEKGWRMEYWRSSAPRRVPLDASLFALASAGQSAVCASLHAFPRSGHSAVLFVAVPGPMGREALITAQPPQPSRRIPYAVLAGLARRLLEVYGVSYTRLVARLARLGGGEAALLVLVEKRGGPPAPLAYYASTRGVCISYSSQGVVASGGRCRPPGVFAVRPQGGAVRVEYVGFSEALRS
jgi:hypothetical protein